MSVETATSVPLLAPAAPPAETDSSGLGLWPALAVTTATLHLLLAGVFGFGLGEEPARVQREEKVIAPTTLEQPVELTPPPPEEVRVEPPPLEEAPSELAIPVVDNLTLPPLPELTPIAAVPSTVPVAFAIAVKGPVRLTNDPARAGGTVGNRGGPVSLDADGRLASNLVLPALTYPPLALQRRITGTVDIEFRVSASGGSIDEARVRHSSGFSELDSAALQNLRQGRWLGSPGYYVKIFAFSLKK